MTTKITGRVKGACYNTETAEILDLNKVQYNKTVLSKEVWEIPDNKRKEVDFFEKGNNTPKKENTFPKEREFFVAERSVTSNDKTSPQKKRSIETQKGRDFLNLNNVQNTNLADYSAKTDQESEAGDDNKEIAFFTEPKSVKRKTQRHIFGFQAITAVTVCLIMLLLKLFAPELYDNLHLYYVRLFQW